MAIEEKWVLFPSMTTYFFPPTFPVQVHISLAQMSCLLLRELQREAQNIPELEMSGDLILYLQVKVQSSSKDVHLFLGTSLESTASHPPVINHSTVLSPMKGVLSLNRVKSFLH